MGETDDVGRRVAGAWARVLASLAEGVQYRLDLFALELGEARGRLLAYALSLVVAAVALFMAFLCLNLMMVVIFWDQRVTALLVMSGVYVLVGLVLGVSVWAKVKTAPKPFAMTVEELKRDRAFLTSER